MNKFWYLLLSTIIFCGTTTVLTACGDDDDDDPTPSKSDALQKVSVTYTMAISPDLTKDFRVNAYYTDEKGNSSLPETVEKANWQKTIEVEASKLPMTFKCYYALAPINKETGATATVNGNVEISYALTAIPVKANGLTGDARNIGERFLGVLESSKTVLKTFAEHANSCTQLTLRVDKEGKIEVIK